jgi:hypothetical protein
VGRRGLVTASSSPGSAVILAQLEEEAGTIQQVRYGTAFGSGYFLYS